MPLLATAAGQIWYAEHLPPDPRMPTLMLLHGAGGSRLDFPAEIRRLPNARVIVFDLPGHGESSAPARTSIEAMARDVIALMDALKIERAVIGGHSMGGAVALACGLNHRARVLGLLLISTGAKLPVPQAALAAVKTDPARAAHVLASRFWAGRPNMNRILASQQQILKTPPAAFAADLTASNAFDVSARLDEITVPTMVLVGREDALTPPALSRELYVNIVGAHLVVLDDAAHMVLLEQPVTAAAEIGAWLDAIPL